MKWLRETHGIFININVGWRDAEQVVPEYGWWVERLYSAKHHVRGMVVVENTYKDACNAAIMYCLEKLV